MKRKLTTIALCGMMILNLFQFSKSCPDLVKRFPGGLKYNITIKY